MLFVALVFLSVSLSIEWLRRRWSVFQIFKRMGVPGPEPSILWGNYRELRENHLLWLERWHAQYGPTFGVFWGDKPLLVTCDLDVAREVLVSKFSNFVSRSSQFALESAHPIGKHMVTITKGQAWKQTRMLLSPAFSTSKMRNMTPLVSKSIDGFEANLRRHATGEPFDIYQILKRFTIENIGRTVFGVDCNVQQNPDTNSRLLKSALNLIDAMMSTTLDIACNSFSTLSTLFGSLLHALFTFNLLSHPVDDLVGQLDEIVKLRRNAPPRNDLLQSLLDSQQVSGDEAMLMATDSAETRPKIPSTAKTIRAQLSNDEVSASAVVMFMAGYETTSTAGAFILACLGQHPDVQQRLRKEIVDAIAEKPLCYDTVMTLPYLDCVVREALRLYPPVTCFTTRAATNDVEINGMVIPAGMGVLFPTKLIHTDETSWPDPMTFNPDRFLERTYHQQAYQPFGDGPRNCVGMKFALMTLKMMLCRVLPKFEFVVTEKPVVRSVFILTQPVRLNISVKEISA